MNIRVGTSYFVSVSAAHRYYAQYGETPSDVSQKIINGEIHIGKPALNPGQRLAVVDNGRYAIEEVTP